MWGNIKMSSTFGSVVLKTWYCIFYMKMLICIPTTCCIYWLYFKKLINILVHYFQQRK